MTFFLRFLLLLAAAGITLSGQRLFVVSEFQRIRPDGETYSADRVERRREIISPAVARNAWATFRVVVEAPPQLTYYIYLAQNPDDTVQYNLYQEEYARKGEEWVPDTVKKLSLPVTAMLPDGQKAQTYLLDIWVPDTAPVARFRFEVQLFANERWIIYPMEIRVTPALVPAKAEKGAAPRDYICGPPSRRESKLDLTRIQSFTERNFEQDLMLAKVRESAESRDFIIGAILRAADVDSTKAFCEAAAPFPRGAEWWLRARDYLIK